VLECRDARLVARRVGLEAGREPGRVAGQVAEQQPVGPDHRRIAEAPECDRLGAVRVGVALGDGDLLEEVGEVEPAAERAGDDNHLARYGDRGAEGVGRLERPGVAVEPDRGLVVQPDGELPERPQERRHEALCGIGAVVLGAAPDPGQVAFPSVRAIEPVVDELIAEGVGVQLGRRVEQVAGQLGQGVQVEAAQRGSHAQLVAGVQLFERGAPAQEPVELEWP
jgi:hypothetical protein